MSDMGMSCGAATGCPRRDMHLLMSDDNFFSPFLFRIQGRRRRLLQRSDSGAGFWPAVEIPPFSVVQCGVPETQDICSRGGYGCTVNNVEKNAYCMYVQFGLTAPAFLRTRSPRSAVPTLGFAGKSSGQTSSLTPSAKTVTRLPDFRRRREQLD